MTQTIGELMDRIKNLREFTITVEVPEGMRLSGVMPFNATISQNTGTFRVYALTEDEAKQKVSEFLNR
jgi:hypothetical protein